MTIKQAIEEGTKRLKLGNVQEAKIKVKLLMQYLLEKPREYIIINDEKVLDKKLEEKFFEELEKLTNGVPIEHITHKKEFMKLNFYVDENVLIPRQDTEVLVEEVIEISKKNNAKKILDLCTGSGCICVSLAKYLKNVNITAIDVSKKAIEIAKENAKQNQVLDKITFLESDLFEVLDKDKYDIIVSNPPYIKKEVIPTLDLEVQNEPYIALNGGKDGLDFYKKIINKGYKYLNKRGFLCLEIGYDQKDDIIKLIKDEKKYKDTYCKKDLELNDRVIVTKIK